MKRNERRGFLTVCCIVCMAGAVCYGVVSDDFSVDHDYLTTGSVSFWDGYTINDGVQTDPQDASVQVLSASGGQLTMTTISSDMQATWDDGLALFTTVPAGADFTATVKVVGGNFESLGGEIAYYNGGGLLVRGTDPEAVANQDFICLVAFDMPGWNAVYLWSNNDDNAESEEAIGPSSTPPLSTLADYPWQRITRVGSVFTAYVSADGTNWIQIGSYWDRADLAGQMEVCLHHCTYTTNQGSVVFDDFSLDYEPAAYAPVPKSRQGMVSDPENPLFSFVPLTGQVLSWSAPSDPNLVSSHTITYDVYLSGGEDPNIFKVSDDQEETSYTPTDAFPFPMDTTYTWYVDSTVLLDDANNVSVVSSPVWAFHTVPPNLAPVVNAGVDLYTWPSESEVDPNYITVTLNGSATDDDFPAGRTLAYLWEVDSTVPDGYADGVSFSEPNIANPVVTIAVTLLDVRYNLELTVTEVVGTETFKSDSDVMSVFVYSNSCEAARAKSGENVILADSNYDCILNLTDLAAFTEDWLRDTNQARPE